MIPLVLAMVGTDHHRFDRLVDWVDEAARRYPQARFLIQYGASRAPRVADGAAFLTQEQLDAAMADASGLICHGGPGTIMDGRRHGLVPICAPRDPQLSEHVDAHQQRFAALVHRQGLIHRVLSRDEFDTAVDHLMVLSPGWERRELALDPATSAARCRITAELDRLMAGSSRRRIAWRSAR